VATKIIMTFPSVDTTAPCAPRTVDHLCCLCKLVHARAKSPTDTMYCAPLNSTAFIIVVVCIVCFLFGYVNRF